ncbi:MAG TPA: hypothetical protein V6C46_10675 [Coleofasciculaceae cyanobacterium]
MAKPVRSTIAPAGQGNGLQDLWSFWSRWARLETTVDACPRLSEEAIVAMGRASYPLVRFSANEFEYTEIIAVEG